MALVASFVTPSRSAVARETVPGRQVTQRWRVLITLCGKCDAPLAGVAHDQTPVTAGQYLWVTVGGDM
jgi:hypothetical protein